MILVTKCFDDGLKRFQAPLAELIIILFVIVGQAQDTATTDKTSSTQEKSESHRIQARHITDPIKVDGLLDEPVWATAEAATNFRQESPTEGAPASEKTEVRILYDNKNVYVGIRAFDSEPTKINARDLV